ncbi:putative 30S ribosomal subunit S4 [Saccharata proteae CBS 121410]|uniref:Small ribosomal subunit protein uS4m n=1 Tax=Saccharata proteae CBS 121410 TaxID=1314787 RepID=A0A6A5YG45_9PEZI|nr:putative 30S ribosomal subunit S4 [Saccharata proteae CBS 121410]
MRKRLHALKHPRLRADWSKENLYNLARQDTNLSQQNGTFFQQKWDAKSRTRAFHGEYIGEKKWQRMFKRTLPAVAPMEPRYLAQYDGSEQAKGRGSGLVYADGSGEVQVQQKSTPYMNMTFGPIERRLDMAVWRALFASSARQARQFVVHGWVKVNGKKMIYPGYQLNPGDMFQVDPERVMWATGARKDEEKYIHEKSAAAMERRNIDAESERDASREKRDEEVKKMEAAEYAEHESSEVTTKPADEEATGVPKTVSPVSEEDAAESKRVIESLLERTKALLENEKDDMSAKRKQDLRGFSTVLTKMRGVVNRGRGVSNSITDDLEAQLAGIITKLRNAKNPGGFAAPEQPEQQAETLTREQEELLAEAMKRLRENPIDETKPYATPWRPRPFMSAFAFIPRYLEVNQNVCAAVYLRHPVARPGLAEVPTPFPHDTNQLAFAWYLRRR